jgi:WXG100 family type VII secretion target
MSDPIHVDPEKLREFATNLRGLSQHVDGSLSRLNGHLSRLASTWRDQEFTHFREETLKTQQLLKSFVQEVDRIVPSLQRDAERIAEYQRVAMPRS